MRVLVCGAGETGIAIASQFSTAGHDVVLMDEDPDALARASELLDVSAVVGNILHRSALMRAEVSKADAFVAVTGNDAENLVAAGIAKHAGARVTIARVDSPHFYASAAGAERDVLGVDAVLCATRLAASELLGLMPRSDLVGVHSFSTLGMRAAFAPIGENSVALHKAPRSITMPDGATLARIAREGFLRPIADVSRLEVDDQLLFVGKGDVFLDVWTRLFPAAVEERVLIVGGGDIGEVIASALASRMDRVDLIEVDHARAAALSERLDNVTVLAGDARRAGFLRDLQIDSVGYLLAVTQNDETNLLVSLLGRRLGARKVFTLLRQPGHAELFSELGIEGATGAYEILARTVFDLALPQGLVGECALEGTGYQLLEWRCPEGAPESGDEVVVASVPLTPSASVVGISRGLTSIEVSRQTRLFPKDTMLIVVSKRERDDLLKRLKRFNAEGWA